MNFGLKDKWVIVTGGSAGIGLGCCKCFAQEGCNIIMNYRSDDMNASLKAKELSDTYGVKVITLKADVSDENQVEQMYAKLDEAGIVPDFLINNAAAKGKSTWTSILEMSTEQWRLQEEGTLNSAFFNTRCFAKRVVDTGKKGAIVNVVSKSAFLSSSVNNSHYASMKGGLSSFTRATAKELISKGIRANAIIPGYVKTEKSYPDGVARTEEKKKLLPTGQFATPEDMGVMCVMLCSDLTYRSMNGVIVDLTGGTMV